MVNLFSFIFYFIRWISWNRIIISFVVTLYSFVMERQLMAPSFFFFFLSFNTNYLMMKRLKKKNLLQLLMVRLVHVFENWKLLFENICENTCGWKSVWEYVKYCLKTKNCCLKIQTKHPLIHESLRQKSSHTWNLWVPT